MQHYKKTQPAMSAERFMQTAANFRYVQVNDEYEETKDTFELAHWYSTGFGVTSGEFGKHDTMMRNVSKGTYKLRHYYENDRVMLVGTDQHTTDKTIVGANNMLIDGLQISIIKHNKVQ